MAVLSERDVRENIDPIYLRRGRDYQRLGRVIECRLRGEDDGIEGKVQGTRVAPYRQEIRIRNEKGNVRVDGDCTCPVGYNCKHVAAVLLAALEEAGRVAPPVPASRSNGINKRRGGAKPRQGQEKTRRGGAKPRQGPNKSAESAESAEGEAMSTPLRLWLTDLAAAVEKGEADSEAYSQDERRRLVYVLDPRAAAWRNDPSARVLVRAVTVRLLKAGGYGTSPRSYDPANVINYTPAKYLRPADLRILHELHWAKRSAAFIGCDNAAPLSSEGRDGADLLTRILATGRCHLGGLDGPILAAGPARKGRLAWQEDRQGCQTIVALFESGEEKGGRKRRKGGKQGGKAKTNGATVPDEMNREGMGCERTVCVLPLVPPFYVDEAAGLCGPLETALPALLAARLLAAPPVPAREARALSRSLGRLPGLEKKLRTRLPRPQAPKRIERREVTPTPRLQLIAGEVKYDTAFFRPPWRRGRLHYGHEQYRKETVPLARLSFLYDGMEAPLRIRGDRVSSMAGGVQLWSPALARTGGEPLPDMEHIEGDKLIVVPRDGQAEDRALQTLDALDFCRLRDMALFTTTSKHGDDFFLTPDGDEDGPESHTTEAEYFSEDRFLIFSAEIVSTLEAEGWQVDTAPDYPHRIARGEVAWWAGLGVGDGRGAGDGRGEDEGKGEDEGSGIGWFDFSLGIDFGGARIDLLGPLLEVVRALPNLLAETQDEAERDELLEAVVGETTFWHRLEDGRALALPGARMLPMIRALLQFLGPRLTFGLDDDGALGLNALDAVDLAAFREETDAIGLEWRGKGQGKKLLALGEKLRGLECLPSVAPPPHLTKILRPYQKQGLDWLTFLGEAGFGSVLADDMGLGKTLQTLAFLCAEKAEGRLGSPALIVSPTSVLPNWQAEAVRFAPDLSLLALHGAERKARFAEIADHDMVLTTYPLLARDREVLAGRRWSVVVLDEAQVIKNPRAQVTRIAGALEAGRRIALTGTPLENNLDELWSLFDFVNPGLLGDLTGFRRRFRTPIEKHGDGERQAFLSRRIRPFLLRRTKEAVASELPPKTEIAHSVTLNAAQRDLYETIRLAMDKRVREAIRAKGLGQSRIVVLDALLKLRQVCCDPRLVKLPAARKVKASAKLERLMKLLPEMIAEGRRVLLFSQFTSMLDLIASELAGHGIDHVRLTGRTKDRKTPVVRFQAGEVPLFLISLRAGGTGLNLTAADTVIHYDPWWNPAVENQATDRAHRIGQDKPVFVHRLIVSGSVEEAIGALKARKAALADALFAQGASGRFALTEDDIAALFAPL